MPLALLFLASREWNRGAGWAGGRWGGRRDSAVVLATCSISTNS